MGDCGNNVDDDTAIASPTWIELTDGKQYSRLLYPNPVCFLSISARPSLQLLQDHDDVDGAQSNVMILSWLTATNNHGRFMFSINKRRHTASLLTRGEKDVAFTLSVPVHGMEDLVLATGSVSGRFGNKLMQDSNEARMKKTAVSSNHRKRKKMNKILFETEHGGAIVSGLKAVQIGSSDDYIDNEKSSLFAIHGTVAHLVCRAYRIIPPDDKDDDGHAIDSEHYLLLAQVEKAFVHPSYWDTRKTLFRPKSDEVPPYLTFFGSQTFGYVNATP